MKYAVWLIVSVIAAGCSKSSETVDCYAAASASRSADFCTIHGSIEQEATDFRVVPFDHDERTPRLVIVSDPDKWPNSEEFRIVGTLSYCGPYSKHLGDFVEISVPFNTEGSYAGELVVNHCAEDAG